MITEPVTPFQVDECFAKRKRLKDFRECKYTCGNFCWELCLGCHQPTRKKNFRLCGNCAGGLDDQ